jgi:hypothetical protein
MVKYIRQSGVVIITVVLVYSLAIFVNFSTKKEKQNIKNLPQQQRFEVVDSTWYTSPGEENSMQVDYIYYSKTRNGRIFRTKDKAFQVGDTVFINY